MINRNGVGILLVGGFGSGKQTLVNVARRFVPPFAHFSSGEYFRSHIDQETPLGLQIKSDVAGGQYITDATVISVCEKELPPLLRGSKSKWLDGFPRTKPQLEAAISLFHQYGMSLEDIFLIEVTTPIEELVLRAQKMETDPDRSTRTDSAIKSALSRIYQDADILPGMVSATRNLLPQNQCFEVDGTHMRTEAPKFLREIGFKIPQTEFDAYYSELDTVGKLPSDFVPA